MVLPEYIFDHVQEADREYEEVSEAQIILGADSAWLEGGIKDRGIYRQGDLLYMNPALDGTSHVPIHHAAIQHAREKAGTQP